MNDMKIWTQACFKQLPEYTSPFITNTTKGLPLDMTPLKTPFSQSNPKELLNVLDTFIYKCHKTDLIDNRRWLGNQKVRFFDFEELRYAYIQKKEIQLGSQVCIVGDLHGSVHSLLRTLWRLVAAGHLDHNFKIIDPEKFYMVFLGDYTDRGRYGAETWYTLLRLKLANWDNVMMLRGNHEVSWVNEIRGFACELNGMTWHGETFEGKFNKAWEVHDIDVFEKFSRLYSFLPGMVLLSAGQSTVQFCHGSIQPDYNPEDLLTSDKTYQKVGPFIPFQPSFVWDNFGLGDKKEWRMVGRRMRADVTYVQEYLDKHGLKAVFRAHQHEVSCLKMMTKQGSLEDDLVNWCDVVSSGDQQSSDGFAIKNYAPVFTFSSSPEGVSLSSDCYSMLKTAEQFDDWKLRVHEADLGAPEQRDGKYVSLAQNQEGDDVEVTWSNLPHDDPVEI